MDPKLFALFSDAVVRRVFIELAKRRKVSLREFQIETNVNIDKLTKDLERLRAERLVEKVSSSHRDFDTYYVTEDGLRSYRALTSLAAGI